MKRVVAGAVLRAEAAAHVLADDADPVGRRARAPRRARSGRPRCTGSRCSTSSVSPIEAADRLVGLQRVVEHDLGAVGRPDDDVGLGEPALEVAALAARAGRAARRARRPSSGSSSGSSSLPLDLDQRERRPRLPERVGADRRDRGALVARSPPTARSQSPGPITPRTPGAAERGRQVDPRARAPAR